MQGRKKLLELLGLSLDFSYDEELRSEIHCNLLYDSYTYSVDKGFSWKDVCIAVQLTQQLLTQTLGKEWHLLLFKFMLAESQTMIYPEHTVVSQNKTCSFALIGHIEYMNFDVCKCVCTNMRKLSFQGKQWWRQQQYIKSLR